ncbi:14025_t:CDS:2, partial [Acaulospora colombiana]
MTNEVCVFMDIDDEWALQDITSQIEEFRKDKSPEIDCEFSSAPDIAIKNTVRLQRISIYATLTLEHAIKHELLIIIPWIVLQELDGLKSRPNRTYNFSDCTQPDLQKLAQNAIYFLHNCLVDRMDGIRGQRLDEKIEKHDCNDDKILDCCSEETIKAEQDNGVKSLSKSFRQERCINPNVVYNKESERFIEDTDTIMMDCDDSLQGASPSTQNSERCVLIPISHTYNNSMPSEVAPRPQLQSQHSDQPHSPTSNFYNNHFDPASLSLYNSVHASSNHRSNAQTNKANDEYLRKYSAGTSLHSLYASIHASKNFKASETPTISDSDNKAQEVDVISMMISRTPAVPKRLLSNNIGPRHKQLVDKIMIDLHTFLLPAILFHFQDNFGQDWTYIIKESQPWSLQTMIKFIDRYWMTVFSDIFQRSRKIKEVTIPSLLYFIHTCQQQSVNKLTIQEMMQFIQNSEVVLMAIYDGVEGTIRSASEREI